MPNQAFRYLVFGNKNELASCHDCIVRRFRNDQLAGDSSDQADDDRSEESLAKAALLSFLSVWRTAALIFAIHDKSD